MAKFSLIKDIRKLNEMITEHASWTPGKGEWRKRFLALAIAGEAGELGNDFKKGWRGDDHTQQTKQARERHAIGELVDVYSYVLMMARELGILESLPGLAVKKLIEVEQRPAYKRKVAARKMRETHYKAKNMRLELPKSPRALCGIMAAAPFNVHHKVEHPKPPRFRGGVVPFKPARSFALPSIAPGISRGDVVVRDSGGVRVSMSADLAKRAGLKAVGQAARNARRPCP